MNEVKEDGISLLTLGREFQKQVSARAKVGEEFQPVWCAMVESLSQHLPFSPSFSMSLFRYKYVIIYILISIHFKLIYQ